VLQSTVRGGGGEPRGNRENISEEIKLGFIYLFPPSNILSRFTQTAVGESHNHTGLLDNGTSYITNELWMQAAM